MDVGRAAAGPPDWRQDHAYRRGLELLNRGNYFAAHEALEGIWRDLQGEEKQFVQGLIQVAVALHHQSSGNAEGAMALMARAERNLQPYPDSFGDIDVAAMRAAVARWLDFLTRGGPAPPAIVTRSAR